MCRYYCVVFESTCQYFRHSSCRYFIITKLPLKLLKLYDISNCKRRFFTSTLFSSWIFRRPFLSSRHPCFTFSSLIPACFLSFTQLEVNAYSIPSSDHWSDFTADWIIYWRIHYNTLPLINKQQWTDDNMSVTYWANLLNLNSHAIIKQFTSLIL